MPAITQPRTFMPFVGPRYGQFNKQGNPDFLHGTLDICLLLKGEVRTVTYLTGDADAHKQLHGKVEVNP